MNNEHHLLNEPILMYLETTCLTSTTGVSNVGGRIWGFEGYRRFEYVWSHGYI